MNCGKCRFFEPVPAECIEDQGAGKCHRYPKVATAVWAFPWMHTSDWCGKFKPKPSTLNLTGETRGVESGMGKLLRQELEGREYIVTEQGRDDALEIVKRAHEFACGRLGNQDGREFIIGRADEYGYAYYAIRERVRETP